MCFFLFSYLKESVDIACSLWNSGNTVVKFRDKKIRNPDENYSSQQLREVCLQGLYIFRWHCVQYVVLEFHRMLNPSGHPEMAPPTPDAIRAVAHRAAPLCRAVP